MFNLFTLQNGAYYNKNDILVHVSCGLFPSKELHWCHNFVNPLMHVPHRSARECTVKVIFFIYSFIFCFQKSESGNNKSRFERERIEQAKRIMKPFFLRRLKCDVLKVTFWFSVTPVFPQMINVSFKIICQHIFCDTK